MITTQNPEVLNVDSDPFFEEVSLGYDAAARQWNRALVDSDGDNLYDVLYQDTVLTDSDYEVKYVLPNLQTGNAVFRYEDSDNDGVWDVKLENTDMTNKVWENTYTQFDPNYKRWGAVFTDSNGDGKPDVMWRDTDMTNDDWEEKLEDLNGDGVWDVRWQDLDPRDNDWEARFTQRKGNTEVWQQCELDSDADGVFDVKLVDTNGDGQWDEEYRRAPDSEQWVKKASSEKR